MNKGFTLVEVMITFIAAMIAAAIIIGSIGGCEADWERAEKSAAEYAKKLPGATGEVSCMKKDTDNDGYCRCTIFRQKKDPLHVECGCEHFCFICTDGCSGIKHSIRATR